MVAITAARNNSRTSFPLSTPNRGGGLGEGDSAVFPRLWRHGTNSLGQVSAGPCCPLTWAHLHDAFAAPNRCSYWPSEITPRPSSCKMNPSVGSNPPRRRSDSRTHGVSLRPGELGDDVPELRRLSCGEIRPGRERGFHMLWSLASCSRSAERSTAVSLPVFFHQCAVTWVSRATSPLLWTIGTAQLLAYSVTSPVTT